MSNAEIVKAKIKEGKLDEAMAMAMIEAMKLDIVTTSGDSDNSGACQTSIDLLENKIEHQLGNDSLKNFHFAQVEKAHGKILENVQNIQEIFALLQDNLTKISQ